MTPKYGILPLFVPLVKHHQWNYLDDDDQPLKTTCQHCNGYVRCSGKNG